MNIILLGPPGAGKGTQAEFLSTFYHIPKISTGALLRDPAIQGTPVGLQIKALMDAGQLISDKIIMELVELRIQQADCMNGFLFDGFPRTLPQAEAVRSNGIFIDFVIEIEIEDDEIVKRLSGRRIHPGSGRIYHILHNSPKVPNTDDVTGEPLIQRNDDTEVTIRERLRIYHQQTKPVLFYYKEWQHSGDPDAPCYISINGHADVDEVHRHIFAELKKNSQK